MYRRTLLIRRARAELRDGRGLVLAAATGAALFFLGSDLVVALAAGVAVEAVKAIAGAAPALARQRRVRVTDTEAAQWLDRAEEALVVLRKLARGSPPGPLAQRCAEIAERAIATVWAMRRIAEQGNAVGRLLERMPVTNVTAERAMLERELAATSDPRLRDDLARSLAAVRTQVEVRAQLASSRHLLIARMRSVALGMEGLVARLAELLALAATGVASADDRVGELEAQLDALREGLLETEQLGQEGIERLAAASKVEVGK
jgi:hypothetical protein